MWLKMATKSISNPPVQCHNDSNLHNLIMDEGVATKTRMAQINDVIAHSRRQLLNQSETS
jgi:hypothetical protein